MQVASSDLLTALYKTLSSNRDLVTDPLQPIISSTGLKIPCSRTFPRFLRLYKAAGYRLTSSITFLEPPPATYHYHNTTMSLNTDVEMIYSPPVDANLMDVDSPVKAIKFSDCRADLKHLLLSPVKPKPGRKSHKPRRRRRNMENTTLDSNFDWLDKSQLETLTRPQRLERRAYLDQLQSRYIAQLGLQVSKRREERRQRRSQRGVNSARDVLHSNTNQTGDLLATKLSNLLV
ncbi:hypothetical protein BT96DRAFT_1008287 [Gymnopus androsaceus JB14]|uniref:Uncharacterized protein n=1 Tax=Gymnopus androsaceus JB14 TaxID=1447944 RepID=A0A6A4GFH2_9AGAR|nr:hypothetical protein BT96DRAFT_1008287 [Gymnopus androsaceus JB14]